MKLANKKIIQLNRTSLSLPDDLEFSSSDTANITTAVASPTEQFSTNNSFKLKSPRVPFTTTVKSPCSDSCSIVSGAEESVRSPMLSEPEPVKSPISECELSSSSGSYSVTSVSKGKSQFQYFGIFIGFTMMQNYRN